VYNGNFDITKILNQSNLRTQRCRLIFWVECSVGGYLVLAKTLVQVMWKIFIYDFMVPLCVYLVRKYEKNAVANDK
jgi:hypothetical protein